MNQPSKRGPKRRHNPNIPKHIDQAKIPDNVYYDHRGRGAWYILSLSEGGRRRRKNIATAKATLAELHKLVDELSQTNRDTLRWLCEQFRKSRQYKELASKTRSSYEYADGVVLEMPTRIGKPFGDLSARKITPAVIQRIIDKFDDEGHPAKANHVLRYLRRVFRWNLNRGNCSSNPAVGVEPAKERQQRRLPESVLMAKLITHARSVGNDYPKRGQKGSCPEYLWVVMEIAYLCRLRGIEVVTLTDANALPTGLLTNRRKGSRNNIVEWTSRLRDAWDSAVIRRNAIWEKKSRAIPMLAERRPIIISRSGEMLSKPAFDTAWQRFIRNAMEQGIISQEERFSLHDLKRKGVTDTKGTRHDKQDASGHRSASMMDVYDLSIPIVHASQTD